MKCPELGETERLVQFSAPHLLSAAIHDTLTHTDHVNKLSCSSKYMYCILLQYSVTDENRAGKPYN